MLSGGGLMLGVMPGCANPQRVHMRDVAEQSGEFSPNIFLTITPDDRVLLALNKAEMGQGVMTASAVLVAEELEVAIESIEPVHVSKKEFEASIGEASSNGGGPFGVQITGGSSSTPENYLPLRRAGAAAREMLIGAAAAQWGARREDCRAELGAVMHTDGRKLNYGALTRAAAEQKWIDDPPLKKRSEFKLIGKRTTRVDARSKVDGTAVYGADFSLPDMVRAYVIHPPTMGAEVDTLDVAAASKMTGVIEIFAFERGVAILADKYWQARAAAHAVAVTWKGGVLAGLDTSELKAAALKQLDGEPVHTMRNDGNVRKAMKADGLKVVEAVYEAPYLAHATMEPMNCTVWVQKKTVRVWAPNQSPTLMAEAVARVLRVDRSDVHVETLMLGGGFGRRGVPDFVAEAALIARRTDRPVHVTWTRESDMAAGYYRPMAVSKMRGAVGADGTVHALSYHGVSQTLFADQSPFLGALFPGWMPRTAKRMLLRANLGFMASGSIGDFVATEGINGTPYAIDNVHVGYTPLRTRLPVSFWRSVGHSFNGFMNETFMDELAHVAGEDPYEFRRRLLADKPRHRGVLEAAAKLGNWGQPLDEGWGRGIAVHESFDSFVAEVAEASIVDGRIRVRRVACAVDCGIAVNPDVVKAQMEGGIIFGLSAALDQSIDLIDGVVQQGNFDTFPVLRMYEAPAIDVVIVDSEAKPTGVGEPGLPPIAAAVSNAIFAATGVRLRRMPLQADWDAQKDGQ